MEVAKKFTSVDDIELTDIGGVYCLNTTPETKRSQVVFTVAKMQGTGTDNILIPVMTYPVELTTQVTKRQLLNSSEFRRAISMGYIRLITREYFNQLMSEPGAMEIVNRELNNMKRAPDTKNNQEEREHVDPHDGVNPKYILEAEALVAGDITERALITNIKASGDLTRRDAQYLWKTCGTEYSLLRSHIKAAREQNGW